MRGSPQNSEKEAQLDRETKMVGGASARPDQRHIRVGDTVVLARTILTLWPFQQTVSLGLGKQCAARHSIGPFSE